MHKFCKHLIAGVSALVMCLSAMPLRASAATTYKKGDVNGNGTVNSADTLALNNFLHGSASAKDSKMVERLDVNRDRIIDTNDLTIVKNIVLGVANGATLDYQNTANLPAQEARTYYKYNATTGAYKGSYTLSTVNSISTTSNSASTYSIIGDDERWAEDGLQGVVNIQRSSGSNLGTAFIVDNHTLLTAGHCLYNSGTGTTSTTKSNLKFKIFSDYDTESNFTITPIEYQLSKIYVDNKNSNYDYALITVEEDLSDYINFNLGVVRNELYTSNASSQKLLFVTGFGGGGTNVNPDLVNVKSTGDGFLTSTPTSYKLNYDIDTIGGDSGGPVYIKNSDNIMTVIGIHSGNYNSSAVCNTAKRIDTNILQFVYNNDNLN